MNPYKNTLRQWAFVLLLTSVCSVDTNATSVYECKVNGQRVFSDQRCGDDSQQREIATPNGMVSQKPRSLKSTASTKTKLHIAGTDDREKQRLACRKIRGQIDVVHSRMRSGYSATQGNQLNDKLRTLNQRYLQQRCD